MADVVFVLNGTPVHLRNVDQSETFLDWLRESRGLSGTKEGCNEGDCGACTIMVTDAAGSMAINSCILFLAQLDGKAVRTVEGMCGPNGELHPVQQAMIDNHASQCGFCTPGFVVALVAGHMNGARDHDVQMSGNLCRCTGYVSIIKAAIQAQDAEIPSWLLSDLDQIAKAENPNSPATADQLATWMLDNPDGTLVNGATDVGLTVTKGLKPLGKVAFISGIADLSNISENNGVYRIGAGVTITAFVDFISGKHPSLGKMLLRFGSMQVRNSGTIGGNIANGSPIADSPAALVALGARLHLRKGDERRDMALEDYYIEYGQQDRQPGEFVEAVTIPVQSDRLKCYKISKRFDQDISAVLGCFLIHVDAGKITQARIAFGGMAGTIKRAESVETALIGQPWAIETVVSAAKFFPSDFAPLTDMRASADYRMSVSQNLLVRYFYEDQGIETSVLEVGQ